MTALLSLNAVMPHMREDQITEHVLPTLLKACGDKVPNVQFNACKIIKNNVKSFEKNVLAEVICPKLKELTQDGDKDVVYYAQQALNEIKP